MICRHEVDLLLLHLVRQDKERSNAMPAAAYRDPAKNFRFERERAQHNQGEDMQRVRKQDIKLDTWVKPDGIDLCLEHWAIWMGKNDSDVGIQGQRHLRGDGDGYGDSDACEQRRHNEIAEATDAMIEGLSTYHRYAIYHKCGVSSAWRFPNINFIAAASEAVVILTQKLKINVATRMLF